MSSLALRTLLVCALTLSADILLYGRAPGIGLTVFALLLAVLAVVRFGTRLHHAGVWPVIWLLLALGASLEESSIGQLLLPVLGWTILALALMPEPRALFSGILRGTAGGMRSLAAGPSDARRVALFYDRHFHRQNVPRFPFWVYGLPLALVAAFASLIVPANLMLSRWSGEIFDGCIRAFANLELERMLFWLAAALGSYGVMRFRLGKRPPEPAPLPISVDAARASNELRATMLAFAGLNLLYFAANATDAAYLWLALELPAGMTYSQFAHQGSYRLIVAVVLAAATITAFFRINTLQSHVRSSRLLGYAFVIQNLIVLLGAARRLELYVDVYGLTRFRLATFLWLILVCTGFVLIWIKLWSNRPLGFLMRTNAASTMLLLSAVALLNLDGMIADWNVARAEAGYPEAVDVDYLGELGSGALPALARLTRSPALQIAARARVVLDRQLAREEVRHAPWQSWTWRREAAIDEAKRVLAAP